MQNVIVSIIDADHAAFMQRGVSISAAACGPSNIPSQARATGCRVSSDRLTVTLFFSASQAADLLKDIQSNGAIAVVFSEPPTHRTVQVKGKDARIEALLEGDLHVVESYRDTFVRGLEQLGYPPPVIRTLVACAPDELVAVSFTPAQAFSQTPGPDAGEPLRTRA
jgi:hypothetical protein